MVAGVKDKTLDKSYYKSNQNKMLKTYEREGSDYLEKQSEQRQSSI
jgi:hypothetical protein